MPPESHPKLHNGKEMAGGAGETTDIEGQTKMKQSKVNLKEITICRSKVQTAKIREVCDRE